MTKRCTPSASGRSILLALVLALIPTMLGAQERIHSTDPDARLAMFEAHQALAEASPFADLPWQFVGPTNVSGRMTDVAVIAPTGENYTIYVAGASGGVW